MSIKPSLDDIKLVALSLVQSGRLEEAREHYEDVCKRNPGDGESWFMLSAINGQLSQFALSEACSRKVIELNPDFPQAQNNLGCALVAQGHHSEALNHFQYAIQLAPQYGEAYLNLAGAYQGMGQLPDAWECLAKALKLSPDNAQAHANMAHVCSLMGDKSEAVSHFDRALQIVPGLPDAVSGLALIDEREGHYDCAMRRIQPLLEKSDNGSGVSIALAFAYICRHFDRCDEAIERLEEVLQGAGPVLNHENKLQIHFALGKLLDRSGDYERAFHHFQEGNNLKKVMYPPGTEPQDQDDEIINTFTTEFMATAPRAQPNSPAPIFIVGMVRSGTTLVEQILCSHPDVAGLGELPYMPNLVSRLPDLVNGSGLRYPECMSGLTESLCDSLAADYNHKLPESALRSHRMFTDKMPVNYKYLGLITLLFPNAKIIYCRRYPLDNCLSIYFENFAGVHDYAYDLKGIARNYRSHKRLMSHWRDVLKIPLLEVNYESLVGDPEKISQGMIRFCGLPWDSSCLQFHKNPRRVETASYDQVRKPIYSNSVGRWENYAPHLSGLKSELGDAIDGIQREQQTPSCT